MAKARRLATTIKVGDLSKALTKASTIASKEYGVKVGRETVALPGGFIGKVLLPSPGSNVDPMTVASTITRLLGGKGRRLPGTVAWPTPNWPKGPILVGFWDPLPTFYF